eukprot:CAMPEP_0118934170 /NCGR_PEP_ID=MMETSP1169-20130426/13673_1 /TAXON_ID=36882 /ORGANISM="Pyramimonas obovata, Strain CCMP722" /LENGTH=501 /DNA_ID=CAMNT_0006877041 /DNA_START=320 /DNA_END=1825 /DNA_ORIENTATION=+
MASCENLNEGGEGEPINADGGFPAGLRVLAVDDDPLCLRCLEAMLKRCSYDVTTAKTATQAIAYLRNEDHRFDIVLSDVHMPDMDGFKLLEIIGLEMDLPVIMVSANAENSVVLRGITHGAVDYLIKPVRIMELRNIWQHVIRKKHVKPETDEDEEEKSKKKRKEDDSSATTDEKDEDGTAAKKKKIVWSEDDHQEFVEGVTKLATEKAVPKRILDMMGVTGLTRESVASRLQDEVEDSDSLSMPKKPRVIWSVELHQGFVDAVNQLGIDKAVPKRILDLMGVSGLTRENVASHLQKYRLYLKRLNGVRMGKKTNNPFGAGQDLGAGGHFGGVGMDAGHMFEPQQNRMPGMPGPDFNAGFSEMTPMAMPTMGAAPHDQFDVLAPGIVGEVAGPGLVGEVGKINPSLYNMRGLMQARGHHAGVPVRSPAVAQVGAARGAPGHSGAPNDNLIVNIEFPPGEFAQGDLLNQYPLQPGLAHPPPAAQSKAQHDVLHQFLTDTQFN